MVSENKMRELVSQYLHGAVSLDGFSDQFGELFDDIEDSGDAGAIQLSYKVESALADVSAGLISEEVLREILRPLLFVVIVNDEYQASPVKVQEQEASSPQQRVELTYA